MNERNGLTDMGNERSLLITYRIDGNRLGSFARIALGESIVGRVQLDVGSEVIPEAVVASCVVAEGLLFWVMRMERAVSKSVKE